MLSIYKKAEPDSDLASTGVLEKENITCILNLLHTVTKETREITSLIVKQKQNCSNIKRGTEFQIITLLIFLFWKHNTVYAQ